MCRVGSALGQTRYYFILAIIGKAKQHVSILSSIYIKKKEEERGAGSREKEEEEEEKPSLKSSIYPCSLKIFLINEYFYV